MKGKRWVLTAALIVAGIRLYMQVRGKTKTPFAEWAVGWGVTFFFVSMLSETYPQAAGALGGTIVVGDFLVNGSKLFEDLTAVVTGAAKTGLVDHPFGGGSSAAIAGGTPQQNAAAIAAATGQPGPVSAITPNPPAGVTLDGSHPGGSVGGPSPGTAGTVAASNAATFNAAYNAGFQWAYTGKGPQHWSNQAWLEGVAAGDIAKFGTARPTSVFPGL